MTYFELELGVLILVLQKVWREDMFYEDSPCVLWSRFNNN